MYLLLLALCISDVSLDVDAAFAKAETAISDGRVASRPAEWIVGIPKEEYDALARGRQRVYIWVAYRCPSSASQVDGEHRFVTRYRDVNRPAVIVLRPQDGVLIRDRVIEARDCCASTLLGAEIITQAQKQQFLAAPRGGA